ncbi:MAG: hypothetical protein GY861_04330 [bacterium]|nr:hypothetical protein [bacterium]
MNSLDSHTLRPDWLLIYEQTDTTIKLRRTGNHSEFFS